MSIEINKFYDEINKHDTIVILRHQRPDLDAISSQLALKYLISKNFNKTVYAFGRKGIDDFPYLQTVDTYYNQDLTNALYIIVDTANYPRIDWDEVPISDNIIKVDHHIIQEEDLYGKINILYPALSSTCEVVFNIFQEFKRMNSSIELDNDIARLLFCGVYGDTGGFVFPNTTSKTYEMLSYLTKFDFEYEKTILNLRVFDHKLMKIVGYAYSNIVINENGVGHIIFDKEFQKQNNVRPSDLSVVVNFLGNIKELKTWAVFNYHDNFIRVNLRSRHNYNVSIIANQFDGGGHKNASGASIKEKNDIVTIVDMLDQMVINAE